MTRLAITQTNQMESVIQMVGYTVKASTLRVYATTYKKWFAWCEENDHHPLNLVPEMVMCYLDSQNFTRATKQRQLAALRKLAEIIHLTDLDKRQAEQNYRLVKMLKVRDANPEGQRAGKALKPHEVYKLLDVWNDMTLEHLRNRALIAVLLYTGMRRSEANRLEWDHIDFERGLIVIPQSKTSDEPRTVPILSEVALEALGWWHRVSEGRVYVFPALKGMKNGIYTELGEDKPADDQAQMIYRIVLDSAKRAELDIKPHDLRRTLATSLLEHGTPIADASAVLGHKNKQTTLKYAQAKDAQDIRKSARLGY